MTVKHCVQLLGVHNCILAASVMFSRVTGGCRHDEMSIILSQSSSFVHSFSISASTLCEWANFSLLCDLRGQMACHSLLEKNRQIWLPFVGISENSLANTGYYPLIAMTRGTKQVSGCEVCQFHSSITLGSACKSD